MYKLLLIGGGGHCVSILDSIDKKSFGKIGIIDRSKSKGTSLYGHKCVGCDDDLERLFWLGYTHAFLALGSIGHTETRRGLYEKIKQIGFSIPNIVDSTAIVSRHVRLGEGVYIAKGAIVNDLTQVGNGAILNTGCIVEHQCQLGDFVHIGPRAVLCGGVTVGNDTHIGVGSCVVQGVKIGGSMIIGAGSVVTKSIVPPDGTVAWQTAYGSPCKIMAGRKNAVNE